MKLGGDQSTVVTRRQWCWFQRRPGVKSWSISSRKVSWWWRRTTRQGSIAISSRYHHIFSVGLLSSRSWWSGRWVMRAEGSEGVLNDSKCCPSNRRASTMSWRTSQTCTWWWSWGPLLPATTCKKSTAGVGTTTPWPTRASNTSVKCFTFPRRSSHRP